MATLGKDEGDVKADDACAVMAVSLMIRLPLRLEGHTQQRRSRAVNRVWP